MTRATLVRANLRRRLRRTILTVLGLGIALFLFVTLRTFLHTLQTVGDVGSESRLIVSNRLGIVFPLPLAYRARLAAQEGVHTVSYASWFGGIYQDPRNFFANYAVDEGYLSLYPEIVVSDEHRAAFMADRTGALVGIRLMERFGWTVGQTITLQGTIYPGEHRFTIRGVYQAGRRGFDESSLLFHHRYLDEIMRAQMGGEGFVGWYVLGVSDPDRAPQIAQAIDATYENSASPTRSQTEKAFNLAFVGMYGNIGFFLNAIGMAVVFAILMVSANTMAMSARERFGEIAVLKTLGFTDGAVLRLVVAESLVIAGLGLALGLGGALLLFNFAEFDLGGFVPGLAVTPGVALMAAAIALLIAAVSAAVPAWQSARLKVVDALRYVA
ncbi:MAG TPA: FtsX-like permease family protein [Longimicrobiales bacterium]